MPSMDNTVVLVRCSGCFHHITHLLSDCSGHQSPEDVAHHDPPHSSAGFLESGDSQPDHVHSLEASLLGQLLSQLEEEIRMHM